MTLLLFLSGFDLVDCGANHVILACKGLLYLLCHAQGSRWLIVIALRWDQICLKRHL